MCILIHHPINTNFSADQIQDFYNKNSDGFGAIVKHGDTVELVKSIGNVEEITELYNKQVAGKEAIIHLRMKTHGDINIDNCHPYEVIPGLYMAHNGVLSTGNQKDPRMSDTWHYINDFLKPILKENPQIIFNPGFQAMISSHIGASNKFGFMDHTGRTVIINKTSGVVHKGVWYSNTYAWTPWKFGLGQEPVQNTLAYPTGRSDIRRTWDPRYASSPTWKSWNDYDKKAIPAKVNSSTKQTKPVANGTAKSTAKRKTKQKAPAMTYVSSAHLKRIIRQSYNAINIDGHPSVVQWVERYPMAAMHLIYEVFGNERTKDWNSRAISNMVNHDPVEAADVICDVWESMENDLCAFAGIDNTFFTNVQE